MKDKRQRLVRLSSDDWSEVADLIEQCIEVADDDESYSRLVRDKTIVILKRIRTEAVDKGLRNSKKSVNYSTSNGE